MKTYHVDFFVNGEEYELDVPANKTALNIIRDMLDLTGAKEGCTALAKTLSPGSKRPSPLPNSWSITIKVGLPLVLIAQVLWQSASLAETVRSVSAGFS